MTGKKTPAKKAGTKKRTVKKKPLLPSSSVEAINSPNMSFPIVAIGASAGGLEACEYFFKAMPADSGMAFIVISHLDPSHVSLMPELLQNKTPMPVRQIVDGTRVQSNHVYIIPPNKMLSILSGVLYLTALPSSRQMNLPIDSFFSSLAKDQGPLAIAVVLSGTGSDGSLGLKEIKTELGMVMVQSEASAKYNGMPHNAINTGLIDFVLPPDDMPAQLLKFIKHIKKTAAPRLAPEEEDTSNALQKVFILLRNQTDQDFSLYKRNTICRRIERRMNLHRIDKISDYVSYLQGSEREIDILFRELLIGVTNFFRDPEAFDILRTKTLPSLLADKDEGYVLRVWVPGCSSGEEAYSIAMLLHECMVVLGRYFSVQIFATDIDEEAIGVARTALYPPSIVADVSAERLQIFFTKEDSGHYRIKKSIREMLVFAPQNIIKDPPFTKLDLLCCRNLLIYLGPELQNKLLPLFHYSLKPGGILFLGSSESLGRAADLFSPLDKKWKIFQQRESSGSQAILDLPSSPIAAAAVFKPAEAKLLEKKGELSALQFMETLLYESNAPPSIIFNDECNIVYIHGRTGCYLEPAEGKVSNNLLEMARVGLRAELAAAIRKASTRQQEVVSKGLRVQYNGGSLCFDLIVKPVMDHSNMRGLMMASFQESSANNPEQGANYSPQYADKSGKTELELRQELQYAKESLQTTVEELETSNEELKSTNEELQSTNEELQSTNEEMETSKEELQSLNEESITVNTELQSRIDELTTANGDMKNLMDSTHIATIFLDADMCIRRFTSKATELIPLSLTDIGRPLKHFSSNLLDVDLSHEAQAVLDDLVIREKETASQNGNRFRMKARPYRTLANVIDGVVLTFEDITEASLIAAKLKVSNDSFYQLADLTPVGIFHTNTKLECTFVNERWRQLSGMLSEQAMGLGYLDATHPDDKALLSKAWAEAREQNISLRLSYRLLNPAGQSLRVATHIVPLTDEHDSVLSYIGTISLDTDSKKE